MAESSVALCIEFLPFWNADCLALDVMFVFPLLFRAVDAFSFSSSEVSTVGGGAITSRCLTVVAPSHFTATICEAETGTPPQDPFLIS